MFSSMRMKRNCIGGFSLIEVLITSAIIGIVTAIVVIKYGAFNSSVLLRNQAHELALSIREAQVFSVSVRRDDSGFREPYGIYIGPVPTQQYTLFVDLNDNGEFDASNNEEVETFTMDSRFLVHDICLGTDSAPNCGLSDISITFNRPDFDANMDSTSGYASSQLGSIKISGTNDSSIVREIQVRSTGLISVK